MNNEIQTSIRESVLADLSAGLNELARGSYYDALDLLDDASQTLTSCVRDLEAIVDPAISEAEAFFADQEPGSVSEMEFRAKVAEYVNKS